MDRFKNKKIETQAIYEIYRACRLCGAGGGYKMPIIQNVVNLDNCDVELKQKIRECVQIEVRQDDKMPPLICELCVDKVNDFYEFLEMCRLTNKQTRLRLGLPPQTMPRGAPDAGDCILGVTEPIYVHDEDSNEPLADKRGARGSASKRDSRDTGKDGKKDGKEGKDGKGKVKVEPPRPTRRAAREPSPPPRRHTRHDDSGRVQSKLKKSQSPPPKSILKKGKKVEESPVTSPRLKRRSGEADVKQEAPAKRVKIAVKTPPKPTKLSPRQIEEQRKRAKQQEAKQREAKLREAKQREAAKAREAKQKRLEAERLKEQQTCAICGGVFKTPQAMMSHRRCHVVTFTNPKLACTACGEWFTSAEATEAHHKKHRRTSLPYACARCGLRAHTVAEFDAHLSGNNCIPWTPTPDVKCESCWREFTTQTLLDGHRCAGVGARPGTCEKCGKSYMRKSLSKHTKVCKKGVVIPPELRRRLKPMKVRVAKCDPLLNGKDHCDVSAVDTNYGLDKNCVYPYLSSRLRIKSEPSDCMVKINDLDFGSYVHWDSDDDSADSDAELDLDIFARKRKLPSLAACALKTIFSNKFLGKVPRKYRRLKIETIIDSTLNDCLNDLNLNDSDKVISDSDKVDDSVEKVDGSDKKAVDTEDDLFSKVRSEEQVTNDDFDSLFNDNDKSDSGDKMEVTDDKDSSEKKDITERDSLDSSAKNVDENSVSESNNENIGESTNNEEEIDQENSLENQSDDNINSEEKSGENQSINSNVEEKCTENKSVINNTSEEVSKETTIVNSEDKEIIDNTITKVDESPNDNENTNEFICNDKENKIDSEKLSENHDFESKTNTENNPEINELESVNDEEKESKLPNCADGLETGTLNNESLNVESKMDTEDSNKDTNNSIDENISKESTENTDNNKLESKTADSDTTKDKTKVNGAAEEVDDVALNMNDLEDFSGDEYDDTELMAEIDKQIGEKKKEEKEIEKEATSEEVTQVTEVKDTDNVVNKKDIEISDKAEPLVDDKVKDKEEDLEGKDKITLEDLVPKEDVKSMDLDSISDDEFDFND